MDWELHRSRYGYPPARLRRLSVATEESLLWPEAGLYFQEDCPGNEAWRLHTYRAASSSIELDQYHHELLAKPSDDTDALLALISVVYWGNASGVNGVIRPGRALARVRWITHGKKPAQLSADVPATLKLIKEVRSFAAAGHLHDSLLAAMEIPYLGMSFASKLVMFANPQIGAVYDKVIAGILNEHADRDLRSLYVDPLRQGLSGRKRQAETYARWCDYCSSKATHLNSTRSAWTDWNGVNAAWRAVDVERAVFSSNLRAQAT